MSSFKISVIIVITYIFICVVGIEKTFAGDQMEFNHYIGAWEERISDDLTTCILINLASAKTEKALTTLIQICKSQG